ncbi:MAG: 6-bladed beta-propeller [bacterium]|nr:6-bladed beta-propeller [bacterium]
MKRLKGLIVVALVVMLACPVWAQIKNPDKPLKGKWNLQLKKMWETETAGDQLIAVIQNIETGKDGRVYMLDTKNFRIYVFNKDGKYLSTFGSRGEGPGEMKRFSLGRQLFVLENDIAFEDGDRVHYFSLDGAYKKTYLHSISLEPRTFISGDVCVSAPAMVQRGSKGKMSLYNMKTKEDKLVTEFETYEKALDAKAGRSMAVESITPMMFVEAGNGKIYYGMSHTYEITIADTKGKKIGSFSLEGRERTDVSEEYRNHIRSLLKTMRPEVANRLVKALPGKASFFDKIAIDKDGLVYIFVSSPGSGNRRSLDVFSPEGKFLYTSEIKIEEDYQIGLIYFKDDVLVLDVEDDEGNVRLVKYSIKRPAAK